MRLLVSVRDEAEARLAASAGADFIDLKDPSAGALGGLPPARIAAIVSALRQDHPHATISATIGDHDAAHRDEILWRVAAVAACNVDYVKVGIEPGEGATRLLDELARSGAGLVPVLIADQGVDNALVAHALLLDAFPALMLDTQDKRGGSLLERLQMRVLARFVVAVQRSGRLAGLAGALRLFDLPALGALAPDFAGFRSAVCTNGRAGPLDADLVKDLRAGLGAGTLARSLEVPVAKPCG